MTRLPPRLLALGLLAPLLLGCVRTSGSPFFGTPDVHVVDADGFGLTNLTDDGEADAFPAWSPDGTRLASVSGGDAVVVADASGRRLASTLSADYLPAWSLGGTPRRRSGCVEQQHRWPTQDGGSGAPRRIARTITPRCLRSVGESGDVPCNVR